MSENLQDLGTEYPDDWVELWIDGTTPETEGIDGSACLPSASSSRRQQIDSIVAYLRRCL